MEKTKKVLLIGNGFDLAHGLKTDYNSFLEVIKNWNNFNSVYTEAKKKGKAVFEWKNHKLNRDKLDEKRIYELGQIITENSWAKYYKECGAEIEGWIDFEKEIFPVLDLFESIINADMKIEKLAGEIYGKVDATSMPYSRKRVAKLWPKYIKYTSDKEWAIATAYVQENYGLLKEKLKDDLREEFNTFIKGLEVYLSEFVENNSSKKPLAQIQDVAPELVISFNYTETEKIYGMKETSAYHIHGKINTEQNNMVLGINEFESRTHDFIYFVKFFQRIQKRVDSSYKDLIGNDMCIILYIYGHSLDMTDRDILEYLFKKAKEIVIYYYSQKDYETKVINLISIFGREYVESNIKDKIFFIETSQ